MRRKCFFVCLITAIALYVVMNAHYISLVSKTKAHLKSNVTYPKEYCTVIGTITDYNLSNQTATVKIHAIQGEAKKATWQIKFNQEDLLDQIIRSETYEIEFTVYRNQYQYISNKNKMSFDYDEYLYSKGITGQYSVIEVFNQSQSKDILNTLKLQTRQWIAQTLTYHFDENSAYFLKALILGDKSEYDRYNDLKNLGLAHIFAISGLHFGILYQITRKIIPIHNEKIRAAIIVCLMGFLLLIVGGAYSAQRAFYMIVYSEVCLLLRRKGDSYTNISVSLLLILLTQPYAVLSTSMQLSYYAYICVSILYKKLFKTPLKVSILESLRFSFVIQVLLLPSALYYFSKTNAYGFIANLLIVPLIGMLLPLSFLLLLVQLSSIPFIPTLIKGVITGFIDTFNWLSGILPLDIAYFEWFKSKHFIVLIIALVLMGCQMIFWRLYQNRRAFFKLILSSVLIVCMIGTKQQLEISFIDVKHGDLNLIQFENMVILIDTGDGKLSVNDLLRSRGIHSIDLLVLTHAHADHIGGYYDLIAQMPIKKTLVNPSTASALITEHPEVKPLLTVIDTAYVYKNTEFSFYVSPMQGENYLDDPNEDAIACYLNYQSLSGIFLADMSHEMVDACFVYYQTHISNNPENSFDFIKASHHGSKTGFSKQFYLQNKSAKVMIPCGTKFHMPNIQFENLLIEENIQYYTTYEDGEIKLTYGNNRIITNTYLEEINGF